MKKSGILLLLGLFLLSPLLTLRLHPQDYRGGRSRDQADRFQRNTGAVGRMLGEFRTSMSDVLFIKIERYLHAGVGYLPHINESLLSINETQKAYTPAEPDAEGHNHGAHCNQGAPAPDRSGYNDDGSEKELIPSTGYEGTPTLLPTPEVDFRGLIGRLHREVKPWLPPEDHARHAESRELLPWFRLMTLSDPHYVRGYCIGAWWLGQMEPAAAEIYAKEGIRNNPEAFQIRVTLGELLQKKALTLAEANPDDPKIMAVQNEVRKTFREGAELALRQRIASKQTVQPGEALPEWTSYDANDALASINYAVLSESKFGDPAEAAKLARRYLAHYPDNPTLKRALQQP